MPRRTGTAATARPGAPSCSASGRVFMPNSICTPLTMPRSPTGKMSGRLRRNIRNISADHRPRPFTAVIATMTSSSVMVSRAVQIQAAVVDALGEIAEVRDLRSADAGGAQRAADRRRGAPPGAMPRGAADQRQHAAVNRVGGLGRQLLRQDARDQRRERMARARLGQPAGPDALDQGAQSGIAPHQRAPGAREFVRGQRPAAVRRRLGSCQPRHGRFASLCGQQVERFRKSRHRPVPPHEFEHLEHARTDRLARHGDARRVNQDAGLDAAVGRRRTAAPAPASAAANGSIVCQPLEPRRQRPAQRRASPGAWPRRRRRGRAAPARTGADQRDDVRELSRARLHQIDAPARGGRRSDGPMSAIRRPAASNASARRARISPARQAA